MLVQLSILQGSPHGIQEIIDFCKEEFYRMKYGDVPKGCRIEFRDGNPFNLSVNNLVPVMDLDATSEPITVSA